MKLTNKIKKKIVLEKDSGVSTSTIAARYDIPIKTIKHQYRLYLSHGIEIFDKGYMYYTNELKVNSVERVLIRGESVTSVSVDIGLSTDSILHQWIKNYKQNNGMIVMKKKGRIATMPKKILEILKKDIAEMTKEELVEYATYMKAKEEYEKKLKALVQERNQSKIKPK